MTDLLAEFGSGQVLWSFLWFFMFFIWIYLLIIVFSDIFRSHDMGGLAKALWIIFVIVLPYLGVFIYLIAREHAVKDAADREAATRQYVQSVAGSSGAADEIARLADLKAQGVITDAEFQAGKAKALGG
jgi:hypothetical protein